MPLLSLTGPYPCRTRSDRTNNKITRTLSSTLSRASLIHIEYLIYLQGHIGWIGRPHQVWHGPHLTYPWKSTSRRNLRTSHITHSVTLSNGACSFILSILFLPTAAIVTSSNTSLPYPSHLLVNFVYTSCL